ncbi:thioredoxin family protein [Candidatus Parvarchaeota archaeon]|nr:thioredoxin family protein [Candidatus Parvarchaeota archaeon]
MGSDKMAVIELDEKSVETSVMGQKGSRVMFFYASWCGDCKKAAPWLEQLADKTSGVEFFRMDAEKFEGIADKFWVERYPTLVFFRDGTADKNILVEPASSDDIRKWLEQRMHAK